MKLSHFGNEKLINFPNIYALEIYACLVNPAYDRVLKNDLRSGPSTFKVENKPLASIKRFSNWQAFLSRVSSLMAFPFQDLRPFPNRCASVLTHT